MFLSDRARQAALRYALELALERNAAVSVYHVISEDSEWIGSDDRLNPANALLPQQKERLHAFMTENFAALIDKVEVIELVEAGVAHNKIVEKAQHEHADLIVMSTTWSHRFRTDPAGQCHRQGGGAGELSGAVDPAGEVVGALDDSPD